MKKTPKRPRDPAQLAKFIVDVATGEIEDQPKESGKDPAAAALGRKGGAARAAQLAAPKVMIFVRIHKTLRTTPAMAAGVTDHLWEVLDIVNVLEEWELTN